MQGKNFDHVYSVSFMVPPLHIASGQPFLGADANFLRIVAKIGNRDCRGGTQVHAWLRLTSRNWRYGSGSWLKNWPSRDTPLDSCRRRQESQSALCREKTPAYPLPRMLRSSSSQRRLPTTLISALSLRRAAIRAMPAYLATLG